MTDLTGGEPDTQASRGSGCPRGVATSRQRFAAAIEEVQVHVRCMTWNLGDWGKHRGDADEVARYSAAVARVREHRPDVFFGQELFIPAGQQPGEVANSFVHSAGMDCAIGVQGNHAQLGLCIGWRLPIVMPDADTLRRPTPELFWHALLGVRLRIDGRGVDCWVYHGPPRVGREETAVAAERVAEARLVAGCTTGHDASAWTVVCGDWNWLPADRLDNGSYWHPDPVLPEPLTPAQARLASSRAPGEVLVQAGLVSAAAWLRKPLEHTSTGHRPPPSCPGTNYGRRMIDEGLVTRRLAEALVDHRVIDTGATRAISNHLPVMFTLETGLIR